MPKQKKKRTKKYSGSDAAKVQPTITRVQAVNRNAVSQWWFDNKRIAKPIAITSGVVLIVAWLIYELIRVIFG